MNAITTIPDVSQVPDYLRTASPAALTANSLSQGVSLGFPMLSIKGKTWRQVIDGDSKVILNNEGEPRSSINAVIVGANEAVSKTYYPGVYVEGSDEGPDCYSNDGIAPPLDVPDRQAPLCGGCPHNQWGSATTETGSKSKACGDSRRIAVVIGDFDKPFLLRVPATSLKGLAEYGKMLAQRQLPVHGVMTKISFDTSLAYPRLIFSFNGFLTPEQFEESTKSLDHLTMDAILYGNAAPATPPHPAQVPATPAPPATSPVPTTPAAEPEPAPAPAPTTGTFDDQPAQQAEAPAPAPKPRKPRAPRAAPTEPAPTPAPAPAAAEQTVAATPEQVAVAQPAETPANQTTASPALAKAAELLGGLLGSFDDD
jgi:hypothetical protein